MAAGVVSTLFPCFQWMSWICGLSCFCFNGLLSLSLNISDAMALFNKRHAKQRQHTHTQKNMNPLLLLLIPCCFILFLLFHSLFESFLLTILCDVQFEVAFNLICRFTMKERTFSLLHVDLCYWIKYNWLRLISLCS